MTLIPSIESKYQQLKREENWSELTMKLPVNIESELREIQKEDNLSEVELIYIKEQLFKLAEIAVEITKQNLQKKAA